MSTQHIEKHSHDRALAAVLHLLRIILWGTMAYWAFQFVATLWRWALGFV